MLHIFTIITNELDPCKRPISGHVFPFTIGHCGVDHLHVSVRITFALVSSNPTHWEINALVFWNKWQCLIGMIGCNAVKRHH